MRIPLLAGNWKMNTTVSKAVELARILRRSLDAITNVDRVLCPPFVSLEPVSRVLRGSSLGLGAQNMYFETKGAYTGEISPLMLVDLCQFVIIGHSERRQYFAENGELINRKVRAALSSGLKPILCIGESLAENEAGRTEGLLSEQLESALTDIDISSSLVIAYEPVWAIGTGLAATGKQANRTIGFIRKQLARLPGKAGEIRILYGGSVTAENVAEFMRQPEIDGALIGGASLKAEEFIHIVRQTGEIRS